jgi:uncharacterized protein (DUF2235 family)
MKRIVLCFDGTWNRPADENLPSDKQVETNVRRFYESLQETGTDGIKQVKWYDQGVGTHWYDQFIGGAIGTGLEVNIVQGYEFLAKTYEGGDQVLCLVLVAALTRPGVWWASSGTAAWLKPSMLL